VTNFIVRLEEWSKRWNARHPEGPHADYEMGPIDQQKRAASVIFDDGRVLGQLTVWVTGECDAEAYLRSDKSTLLLKSVTLESQADLHDLLGEVVSHFEKPV
jgi:hypothetical protein